MSTLGGALAILVGLVLGLGVLAYVRAERKSRASAVLDASSFSSLGDGGSMIGTKATEEPPPPIAIAPKPPRSPEVTLRMPDDARVVADGVELPLGTRQVRRPDAGGLVTVLIRAEGREDAIYVIDPSSPNEIEVTMIEKPPSDKPAHRKNTVPKGIPSAVPPNPYD
jgi:hypothetical protein